MKIIHSILLNIFLISFALRVSSHWLKTSKKNYKLRTINYTHTYITNKQTRNLFTLTSKTLNFSWLFLSSWQQRQLTTNCLIFFSISFLYYVFSRFSLSLSLVFYCKFFHTHTLKNNYTYPWIIFKLLLELIGFFMWIILFFLTNFVSLSLSFFFCQFDCNKRKRKIWI